MNYDFTRLAANTLKAEPARAGVNYTTLAERLSAMGEKQGSKCVLHAVHGSGRAEGRAVERES